MSDCPPTINRKVNTPSRDIYQTVNHTDATDIFPLGTPGGLYQVSPDIILQSPVEMGIITGTLKKILQLLAILFLLLFLYAAFQFFQDWKSAGELLVISLIGAIFFGVLAEKL